GGPSRGRRRLFPRAGGREGEAEPMRKGRRQTQRGTAAGYQFRDGRGLRLVSLAALGKQARSRPQHSQDKNQARGNAELGFPNSPTDSIRQPGSPRGR